MSKALREENALRATATAGSAAVPPAAGASASLLPSAAPASPVEGEGLPVGSKAGEGAASGEGGREAVNGSSDGGDHQSAGGGGEGGLTEEGGGGAAGPMASAEPSSSLPAEAPPPSADKACAAPETAAGYGASVDFWALGVLMYEMMTGDPPFRDRSRRELYRKILHARLVFPKHLSPAAVSLLKGLLERRIDRRLGCGPHGVAALKAHIFFAGLDWSALARRAVPAPIQLDISGPTDYRHFDAELTALPLDLDIAAVKKKEDAAAAAAAATAAAPRGLGVGAAQPSLQDPLASPLMKGLAGGGSRGNDSLPPDLDLGGAAAAPVPTPDALFIPDFAWTNTSALAEMEALIVADAGALAEGAADERLRGAAAAAAADASKHGVDLLLPADRLQALLRDRRTLAAATATATASSSAPSAGLRLKISAHAHGIAASSAPSPRSPRDDEGGFLVCSTPSPLAEKTAGGSQAGGARRAAATTGSSLAGAPISVAPLAGAAVAAVKTESAPPAGVVVAVEVPVVLPSPASLRTAEHATAAPLAEAAVAVYVPTVVSPSLQTTNARESSAPVFIHTPVIFERPFAESLVPLPASSSTFSGASSSILTGAAAAAASLALFTQPPHKMKAAAATPLALSTPVVTKAPPPGSWAARVTTAPTPRAPPTAQAASIAQQPTLPIAAMQWPTLAAGPSTVVASTNKFWATRLRADAPEWIPGGP